MAWNELPNWILAEQVKASKFNSYIYDNMLRLDNGNVKTVTAEDAPSTVINWPSFKQITNYDDLLDLEITTQGGDIEVYLHLHVTATATIILKFDFHVLKPDGSWFFLSSMSQTPLTGGLYEVRAVNLMQEILHIRFLWPSPAPGVYRIRPFATVNTGSISVNSLPVKMIYQLEER
jgi:hypothetical protein